ncbi:unnamed protein product [Penicillium egyptiacum]|uniref:Signal peptidase complex catalytic subunit SEC11 n=1 Tax=Penicillium egyptiacum TaxID=1303716 RepID=A0A9W4PB59_9EURO|nr:unnamed protein product [Penicillium egyptiacum]
MTPPPAKFRDDVTMRLLQGTAPIIKIIGTALIAWKTACVITSSAYPLMKVSSGSMEPTFYRGDLIFLWNRQHRIHAGDIPVVQLILTKGDNNAVDDTAFTQRASLLSTARMWWGLVRGYVPYVGWTSLRLKESPLILYIVAAVLFAVGVVS